MNSHLNDETPLSESTPGGKPHSDAARNRHFSAPPATVRFNVRFQTRQLKAGLGHYDLSRTNLNELSSQVAREHHTGTLKLQSQAQTAIIQFREGRAWHAACPGFADGIESVKHILNWKTGTAHWVNEPLLVPIYTIEPHQFASAIRELPGK